MSTEKTETSTVHPFERVGLGKAPFRYIGDVKQNLRHGEAVVETLAGGVDVTTKPGGSCAYCGNYILNMFNVRSSDGNTFHVGSDCIEKVGGEALAAKVRKVVNARRATATKNRAAEKIAAAVVALARPEVRAALAAKPHPVAFRNQYGETLLTSVEWMMAHAGTAGKLKAAATIAAVA